jgi:hypothetical protein
MESKFIMSIINSSDQEFRVCRLDFGTLIELQLEAETRGWATRWSSVDALRSQVMEEFVILRTLMREERMGGVTVYRCLILFSSTDDVRSGKVVTMDIEPAKLESLVRLDRDLDTRKAFARIFSLALNGISADSKY